MTYGLILTKSPRCFLADEKSALKFTGISKCSVGYFSIFYTRGKGAVSLILNKFCWSSSDLLAYLVISSSSQCTLYEFMIAFIDALFKGVSCSFSIYFEASWFIWPVFVIIVHATLHATSVVKVLYGSTCIFLQKLQDFRAICGDLTATPLAHHVSIVGEQVALSGQIV